MMRKVLLILFSSLFLIACSSGDEAGQTADNEAGEETEDAGVEVDKGLLNVEITLPEVFFEDDELADIEADMEENHDANVTKNDDGSITVKMSKKEHKQLLEEMSEEFIETIEEVIEDEEFPSIQEVTYSRDFSELQIIVDREGFENSFDGFALFSLGFTSLFYQLFDGKDIEKDKVTMNIVDEATDETIEEVIFPDVFDEMDEEFDLE